jgi:methionyl-tRNA synthetase
VPLANNELHKRMGTLVDRVTGLIHRYRGGEPPPGGRWPSATPRVTEALARFDFVAATDAVLRIVDDASAYLSASRPWELANPDEVLANLLAACRVLANELIPFLPDLASRIAEQCFALSGTLAPARALYPRLKK